MAASHRDKIITKIQGLDPNRPFFSLEFFPPKTQQGRENLNTRLGRMARGLRPLFVTVTWGAGGSTASKSLALAEVCQKELGLTTCLHLTCTNMSRSILDEALQGAKNIGVRNILALRGDPPRKDEYEDGSSGESDDSTGGEFVYAIDLVKYIRQHHGDYFCIGVAAYPEGHTDGTFDALHQDPQRDLPYLVEKVQAGADFIMTQFFYDVDAYLKFEEMLRSHSSGMFKDIPIIPGLMPIQSYQILKRTTKLSNASVPPTIMDKMTSVKHDDEAVKVVGVDILCDIVNTIKSKPSDGLCRGFHFYTLNLEKSVAFILERTDLIPPDDDVFEADILPDSKSSVVNGTGNVTRRRRSRRDSHVGAGPDDKLIVDNTRRFSETIHIADAAEAGQIRPPIEVQPPEISLAISEGEGALGREATWDDFPNGRFGDARSPAFGEIDGYGVSLHVPQAQALVMWGYPVAPEDISAIFIKHIKGQLPAIPWSEQELNPESQHIQPQLTKLNEKGWWTIASQPAVNGARSSHEMFGWGPKNGYVFQKAFLEFWISKEQWGGPGGLLEKLKSCDQDEISWYAGDNDSNIDSNMPTDAVNAVTWGCFPGKEILTPTIIEHVSFRAWREEAFSIWSEWARLYPRRSASAKLLEDIRKDYLLVNIIHHDYLSENGLWNLLLS